MWKVHVPSACTPSTMSNRSTSAAELRRYGIRRRLSGLPSRRASAITARCAPSIRPLPIDAVLADLSARLRARPNAVLVAPPGAGKTTRVPLVLLDEPWVAGRKLILLEPRRLAARAAADRMARTPRRERRRDGRAEGRLGSKISRRTRIEVVTEGVFARMIVDDPGTRRDRGGPFRRVPRAFPRRRSRPRAGARRARRSAGRPSPPRDVGDPRRRSRRTASWARRPSSNREGRAYAVETRYLGRDPNRRIDGRGRGCRHEGPACRSRLHPRLPAGPGGDPARRKPSARARRRSERRSCAALRRASTGPSRTSPSSPHVPVAARSCLPPRSPRPRLPSRAFGWSIDSGLARVPVYEPDIGLTRLETVRVSRAAADQRRGRAGRTEPGVCYRLWEEAGDGRARSLRSARDPVRRSRAPPARLRRLGRERSDDASPSSILRPRRAQGGEGLLRGTRRRSTAEGRITETGRQSARPSAAAAARADGA